MTVNARQAAGVDATPVEVVRITHDVAVAMEKIRIKKAFDDYEATREAKAAWHAAAVKS